MVSHRNILADAGLMTTAFGLDERTKIGGWARVLDALRLGLSFDVLDHINAGRFSRTGVAMSDEDMARVRHCGPILLGAIGDPRVSDPRYARDVLLRLRFELDLYVNHRPALLLDDRLSPLRDPARRAIDCVVVRENTCC